MIVMLLLLSLRYPLTIIYEKTLYCNQYYECKKNCMLVPFQRERNLKAKQKQKT